MDPQSEGYDRGRVGGTESSPGMFVEKQKIWCLSLHMEKNMHRSIGIVMELL